MQQIDFKVVQAMYSRPPNTAPPLNANPQHRTHFKLPNSIFSSSRLLYIMWLPIPGLFSEFTAFYAPKNRPGGRL